MKVPLLDLVAQYQDIKEAVVPAMMAVLERQQFIMGPEVAALEEAIGRRCGVPHAIACASGTDALLLPLKLLGLGPEDEVIVPAFTFFASAGAVRNAGGTPVFVDLDSATFNLDPAAVEAAMGPKTRAIVVVHLFGQMAPVERILALAAGRGIPVIEDAAQALGARRRVGPDWRMAGELGWVGTFSFFPAKNLGAYGDGGMMVTADAAAAERLARLRLHGGRRMYHHDEVGTNSRLDSLQAAVLLAKLPHLDRWSAARARHARRYDEGLASVAEVVTPAVDPANDPIYHQYTIRAARRDELRQFLDRRGIGTGIYYPVGLHLQPCFAELGYRPGSLPRTEAACREVLALPVYPELSAEQQDYVIESIRAFYQ